MTPDQAPPRLSGAVVGLVIAFCALLLAKWLALVALGALVVVALVAYLWRSPDRTDDRTADGPTVEPEPVLPTPRASAPLRPVTPGADDCSWCGLAGGHRDLRGLLVRPRHVHRV